MHLIVTRTFPPEVGGMQNLMYGLAKSLSKNVMIKVFADQYPNQDNFDKELSFSIERVSGPKIFKKYRKANLVKENHNKVVDLINDEINKCGNNDEGKFTVWGDPCNGEWIADKVVNYINENLKIENPFSDDSKVKTDPDPRIKAEGNAGQSVEMGVIFVMSSNFLPDPGSEWIVGTCFKSPCVAAGNNELTSIYR